MNPITGKLVEIYIEDGTTMGRVEIQGVYQRILLTLVLDARVGDRVLVESGMGLSIIDRTKETLNVLGYSGESGRN